MTNKTALITGVTGQDGAYLARFLLKKGYTVHGMKRRASSFNTQRIDDITLDPHGEDVNFFLHYGDLTDSSNIMRLVQTIEPDEIYNLAAQSHVQVSFETAEYTANADAFGTLRILEAIRTLNLEKNTLLSSFNVGTLRQSSGGTAKRNYTVLSALALCGCQALRLLDLCELPRGLQHVCL